HQHQHHHHHLNNVDIVCLSVILNTSTVNSTVPKLADAFNYGDRENENFHAG
ncbi:unnamed protein product, partial [Ceratitis capitata]